MRKCGEILSAVTILMLHAYHEVVQTVQFVRKRAVAIAVQGVYDLLRQAYGEKMIITILVIITSLLVTGHLIAQRPIGHFVFFNVDRHRTQKKSLLESDIFSGVQIKYTCPELEPEKGVYNFDLIQSDLDFLEANGKNLFKPRRLYQNLMEIVLNSPLSLMGRTNGSFQAQIEDTLGRMGCIFPGAWKTENGVHQNGSPKTSMVTVWLSPQV